MPTQYRCWRYGFSAPKKSEFIQSRGCNEINEQENVFLQSGHFQTILPHTYVRLAEGSLVVKCRICEDHAIEPQIDKLYERGARVEDRWSMHPYVGLKQGTIPKASEILTGQTRRRQIE